MRDWGRQPGGYQTNPGQHLAVEFMKLTNQVATSNRKNKYSITVQWTAGHCSIKDNEEADKQAKRAAEGDSLAEKNLPKYISKMISC
jgi:ribonuclease HI